MGVLPLTKHLQPTCTTPAPRTMNMSRAGPEAGSGIAMTHSCIWVAQKGRDGCTVLPRDATCRPRQDRRAILMPDQRRQYTQDGAGRFMQEDSKTKSRRSSTQDGSP
jgi:hypothetical protein